MAKICYSDTETGFNSRREGSRRRVERVLLPSPLLLLLLHRRRQFESGWSFAASLGGGGFEALDGFVGDRATAEGSGMDTGAVKIGAAGGNQAVFVGEGAQGALVLWRVGAGVGFQADHACRDEAREPVAQLREAGQIERVRDDGQAIGTGDQAYRVLRRELVARHVGVATGADICIKSFADGLHIARFEQGSGDVRAANRPLRDLAYALPRNVDALLVEQFDHALAAPLARVAQHLQHSLKLRAFILRVVAENMHFAP